MTLKDISYKGFVRFILFIELAIPIILAPFIALLYTVKPSAVNIDFNAVIDLPPFTFQHNDIDNNVQAHILFLLICFAAFLLTVFIKASILHFIAQRTKIGHIKIGR